MPRRLRLFLFVLAMFGTAAACMTSYSAPPPEPAESEPTAPALSTALPTGTPGRPPVSPTFPSTQAAPAPAILESRRLTLELPVRIRAGDGDTIRMTLEVDDRGDLTPTAQISGNQVQGQVVQIPNLYETHNVLAEARLDLAGAQVTPVETVSEPLSPGKSVTFFWSIRIPEPGTYKGVAWLHMRYIPKSGGPEQRETIAAQLFEIEGVSLLGLTVGPARWLGLAGSFAGSVLGFPFLEDLLRWLWKRRK